MQFFRTQLNGVIYDSSKSFWLFEADSALPRKNDVHPTQTVSEKNKLHYRGAILRENKLSDVSQHVPK